MQALLPKYCYYIYCVNAPVMILLKKYIVNKEERDCQWSENDTNITYWMEDFTSIISKAYLHMEQTTCGSPSENQNHDCSYDHPEKFAEQC